MRFQVTINHSMNFSQTIRLKRGTERETQTTSTHAVTNYNYRNKLKWAASHICISLSNGILLGHEHISAGRMDTLIADPTKI